MVRETLYNILIKAFGRFRGSKFLNIMFKKIIRYNINVYVNDLKLFVYRSFHIPFALPVVSRFHLFLGILNETHCA